MNVLVYVNFNNYSIGGLYRSVFARLNELSKSDKVNEIKIISLHEDYKGILKFITRNKGYKNYFDKDETGFNEGKFFCEYVKLRTYLANKIMCRLNGDYDVDRRYKLLKDKVDLKRYDVIYIHAAYPNTKVVKKIKDNYHIPYVITLHGSDINMISKKSDKTKRSVVETLENAEKCIFVSNKLLNEAIKQGYSGKNSVVIPNGYSKEVFKDMDKSRIRKELNINKKNIGFVGNLIPVKRADEFPDIFKNIYDKDKDVVFTVIGDGGLKETIKEKCDELKLPVDFLGKVDKDKIPYYMNSMDLLILPSRNEGWPCVVTEAIACNVPVVGSNNGGIKEAVGNCGEVVDDGNEFISKFADKVIQVLNSNKSYDFEKEKYKYEWSSIGKKEIEVLCEIEKSR